MIDPLRIAFLLASFSLAARVAHPNERGEGSQPVVSVDVGKGVVVAGQPFSVKLTFENRSDARVKLDAAAARGAGLRIVGVESSPDASGKLADAKAEIAGAATDGEAAYEIPPHGALVVSVDASSFGALGGKSDVADVSFESGGLKSDPARVEVVEDLTKTRVVLETNKGVMKLALDPVRAPLASRNFVRHVAKGTFDGVLFHRVIPGFMAQSGDPLSKDADPANDGQGGAPYNGRTLRAEMTPEVKHERGTLSMARNGDPMNGPQFGQQLTTQTLGTILQKEGKAGDQAAMQAKHAELTRAGFFRDRQPFLDSSGSQFYVCFAGVPHLDGNYTAFGKLVEGDDVLAKLEAAATPNAPGGKPTETLKIEKARLERG